MSPVYNSHSEHIQPLVFDNPRQIARRVFSGNENMRFLLSLNDSVTHRMDFKDPFANNRWKVAHVKLKWNNLQAIVSYEGIIAWIVVPLESQYFAPLGTHTQMQRGNNNAIEIA